MPAAPGPVSCDRTTGAPGFSSAQIVMRSPGTASARAVPRTPDDDDRASGGVSPPGVSSSPATRAEP
jgi:hypothetical protein